MFNFLKKLFTPKKELSLVVIFVEYDRGRLGGSTKVYKTLQTYLTTMKGWTITYLRVDNKNELYPLKKNAHDEYTIGGDNRFHEFSGWQKGFETLPKINVTPDLVLFANDMFLAPGESFLKDYANTELLNNTLKNNNVIGRIDSTGQQYTVYDFDVSQWVCTNCFIVPRKALDEIEDMVSIKENLNDFLPAKYPTFKDSFLQEKATFGLFKNNAPLNDAYKLWLTEWLTERWHSKIEINEDTWDLFRIKVRNILNESLLSARLADKGFIPKTYGNKQYY